MTRSPNDRKARSLNGFNVRERKLAALEGPFGALASRGQSMSLTSGRWYAEYRDAVLDAVDCAHPAALRFRAGPVPVGSRARRHR